MPLKTRVKVGNITNLSDARYCAGMGVELLGFPVGNGGLTPTTYRQIIDWVTGPELVLETDETQLSLEKLKVSFPGHYVQINKNQLHLLDDVTVQFIVVLAAQDASRLAARINACANVKYIEVIGDVSLVIEHGLTAPLLLRFPPGSDLSQALSQKIAGISLTGTEELSPGLKDYTALAEVLEQLEVD